MYDRKSGILMHISSLPSDYGIGDFGKSAYNFIDFLNKSGQKLWQILPLGPTGYGNSPYQCYSAFAGNYLFIDPENIVNEGYLNVDDLDEIKIQNNKGKVDYSVVNIKKGAFFKKASVSFYKRLKEDNKLQKDLDKFKLENNFWLGNYCLFMTFREKFNYLPWTKWPKKYKLRKLHNIELSEEEKEIFKYHEFIQYVFFKQWFSLKEFANNHGVKIIGDIPIFVATDSADTWENKKFFQFTKSAKAKNIAGCPPDYFSKKGQLWGNVLYDWKTIEKDKYKWWIKRLYFSKQLYDYIRIDHFRGFESYWSVRARRKDAIKGKWEKGPGLKFFKFLEKKLGTLPLIMEDLGYLTPRVKKLLEKCKYPGMRVLQFAFGSQENEYLPHNYIENCVAYSGTHDNDTTVGWYESLDSNTKYRCDEYLKTWLLSINRNYWNPINWRFIETLWSSKANFVIVQMQDILGLDFKSRMNIPGTSIGNWQWSMEKDFKNVEIENRLMEISKIFNR